MVPSWPTVLPPPMATTEIHLSARMVTSSAGSSARRATHRSSDGTTALDVLPLAEQRLGVGEHRLDVDRLAGVGRLGVGVEEEVAVGEAQQLEGDLVGIGGRPSPWNSPPTTWPSFSHRLPAPRSPSSRYAPVFLVEAKRRSTSGRAKVSSVP